MRKAKLFILISSLTMLLVGCGETPHEHTFAEAWSTNELCHWHKSTCEHSELVKDFGEHEFNNEGICVTCGFDKNTITKQYSFSFISDYCSLDNETMYEEDTNVDLLLSVKDLYKDAYALPSNINVVIGDEVAINGVDYLYTPSNGNLSLKVTGNVVVTVLVKDDDNYYKISNEEVYNNAITLSNCEYTQLEYMGALYSDSIYIINILREHLSPTVNYEFSHYASCSMSANVIENETYFSKENDKVYKYTYDSNNEIWTKNETGINEYYLPTTITPTYFQLLEGLSYNNVKDKYNKDLHSYVLKASSDQKTYDVLIHFENNKLTFVEFCSNNPGYTDIKSYNYTYFEYTPTLPL